MKKIFVDYLFNHFYFVNQQRNENAFPAETRLALANLFNIRIIAGMDLLQPYMIRTASEIIGTSVPDAFYRGFPDSVRKLSGVELIADQILHYYITYGLNNFDEAGHSIFEEETERKAFSEKTPVKDFSVITEQEAVEKLQEYTENLLSGTRQLSDEQYELVLEFIWEYHYVPEKCASKNTAIRLLIDTRDPYFANFLMISDVTKLADEMNYRSKGIKDPRKLNLPNRDRKLLTAVLEKLIADGKIDTRTCYEKKALWSGLLHHIHYKTGDPKGIEFLSAMRGSENRSAYAEFEAALSQKGAASAADVLLRRKGPGALLRNLDYVLSRCGSDDEIRDVIQKIDTDNRIILIQLFSHYQQNSAMPRSFKFIKYGMMRKHDETASEGKQRETILSKRDRNTAMTAIRELLEKSLKGRLGKVYISPKMKNIAVPLQEGASQGGFGSLSRGSRIPLPTGKKIRAFTYWEKVNDIDLSVIGLEKDLRQREFSWRTMYSHQSFGITFSGDQTSGFNGGSEFYDVDPEKFKEQYPTVKYLIFCNNVFTRGLRFKDVVCRAGFMPRDIEDSGQIFEPKTVNSSFTIDCDSRFALLFALDLISNDFVWLNLAQDSSSRIAGLNSMAFLVPYLETVRVFNVYEFFRMMAAELVEDPMDAEIAVTDEEIEVGENTEIVHSYDQERMIALLN